jgi:curved DNA-binding protein CbpA
MASYYDLLGVAPDADDEELRRAYLARAQLLHPDRHAGSPEPVRRQAEAEMKAVNEAWSTLKDPEARQRYDLALDLAWAEAQPPSPPSFFRRAGVQLAIVVLIVAGLVGSLVAAVVSGGGSPASEPGPDRWTPAAVSELRDAAIDAGFSPAQADCFVRSITSRFSPFDEVDRSVVEQVAASCR